VRRLTPEQQRFFREEGYLGFGPFLDESQAAAVPARPGHGSLHHCLTHHGTPPNRTPHRRRAIICHYMPLDFRYTGPEDDRPPFHVVRGRRCGEIV
jgi:ectoine hydroxylase-related dioxygenase (phytanoyl-CoA dioxygenase family)